MRSAIVQIDESRVEVELIDLVKFRLEALGWHFRYPQHTPGRQSRARRRRYQQSDQRPRANQNPEGMVVSVSCSIYAEISVKQQLAQDCRC